MPRSKQSKSEFSKCDICNCFFAVRDAKEHATDCSCETPFQIRTLGPICDSSSSRNEGEMQIEDLSHGVIYQKILVGSLLETDGHISNIPTSCRDRLVHIHPATVALCGLAYGMPVVVQNQHIFSVWPDASMPLTAIGATSTSMETTLKSLKGKTSFLVGYSGPYMDADLVSCTVSGMPSTDGDRSFVDYILQVTDGNFYGAGNTIHVTYFGKPVVLHIVGIRGANGQGQDMRHPSDLPPGRSEMEGVGSDGDVAPLCSLQEVASSISAQRPFFRMTLETNLTIRGEEQATSTSCSKRKVELDDIGGLSRQKQAVKDLITVHLFNTHTMTAQGLSTPGGVLLFGPSGSGKSMLAIAIGNSMPAKFMTLNGAQIWSKFYGESEAKLIKFFNEAKTCAPVIVFLDEVDTLCPRRDTSRNEVEKRVVCTLLNLLDEVLQPGGGVFVIAATSRREGVDPALRRPGRLDREVETGVPTVSDRRQILASLLKRMDHDVSEVDVQEAAERAHGFVGADLASVCKEAFLHSLQRVCADDGGVDGQRLSREDLTFGLHTVRPSAMKEIALEVPKVRWTDIGGQHELKHKLRQAVEWPLKHPEAFARLGIRPPRGLLMYGPPGCSKTMIAKALAKESGLNFIAIKGPELFSKWVGESERAVREVFHRARAAAPAVVFFDEIDALASERGSHGGGGDVADRVLAQILTEMDGVEALGDVTVVAATNRPDRIDKALMRPGRLDRIVHVPLPDSATRREIFLIHLNKMPTASDMDVETLVTKTARYSGAEVSAVCHEAALRALQEDIDTDLVCWRHFEHALTVVSPRITQQLLDVYDVYEKFSGLHIL